MAITPLTKDISVAQCQICHGKEERLSGRKIVTVGGGAHRDLTHLFHEACIMKHVQAIPPICPTCKLLITHEDGEMIQPEYFLLTAVDNNDLAAVQKILKDAALYRYHAIVTLLLADGPISKEDRVQATLYAKSFRDIAIVNALNEAP